MTNHFTYADGIAVAEEAFYASALLLSLYVTFKHGFSKGSGWVFLTIFCIIRIVGSAAQLATINKTDPQTAETIALVCAVLGLSPLVLSTLGILARV
jgi:low temperature requirement protein LtrA